MNYVYGIMKYIEGGTEFVMQIPDLHFKEQILNNIIVY